jgi:hypothetical protein
MIPLLLAALVLSPARAAESSQEDAALVEKFLKTDTADLPPGAIDHFMQVDPQSVPAKLRKKFEAKKFELLTLKQLAEGKKKGVIRTPEKNCAVPTEVKSNEARILLMAGYEEVTSDDVQCVMERTHCNEQQLMCEFTLQIVIEKKGAQKKYRFFFHPKDPIFAIIAACRKSTGGQNNFFSAMTATCS